MTKLIHWLPRTKLHFDTRLLLITHKELLVQHFVRRLFYVARDQSCVWLNKNPFSCLNDSFRMIIKRRPCKFALMRVLFRRDDFITVPYETSGRRKECNSSESGGGGRCKTQTRRDFQADGGQS
ncbi:PREDICTED: uncharacterized protein LOC108780666 isoform X2 [Cyphomyrmex costatus]|uniref:uncharacterized protein LOC108780666 isoform X2 n=1 Tax=Cyphomyrmex costatus TaxID=456900 RepID=UPI00085230C3|nr:PREDICTED: uncharacterized protein LOC108780666 isoform X2 [Cyphomyrmex costatus]